MRQAIDQRLLLAPAVARAKWNVQAPIEDLPREAQVIAAAVQQGRALGLPDELVEAVFKAQIEASKTVQRELYAKWKNERAGHFDDAPDLAKTIRPELDRITAQLLRSMADNQTTLKSAARNLRPLEASLLSPSAAKQALAPFSGK
nr:gamma subclass chorismate mutase AroQ [Duganella radicis]